MIFKPSFVEDRNLYYVIFYIVWWIWWNETWSDFAMQLGMIRVSL